MTLVRPLKLRSVQWLLRVVRAIESWGIRVETRNWPKPTKEQVDSLRGWLTDQESMDWDMVEEDPASGRLRAGTGRTIYPDQNKPADPNLDADGSGGPFGI